MSPVDNRQLRRLRRSDTCVARMSVGTGGKHEDGKRIHGCRFLQYDVTDWPLVISSLPELPGGEQPTLQDVRDASTCVQMLMHVARFGSDGGGRIPTEPAPDAHDDALAARLPSSLSQLPCGPICTILDLTHARFPPLELVPAIVDLVREVETLARGCVAARFVVVPAFMQEIATAIAESAGGVGSTFVPSLEEAFKKLAESMDGT